LPPTNKTDALTDNRGRLELAARKPIDRHQIYTVQGAPVCRRLANRRRTNLSISNTHSTVRQSLN